MTPASAGPAGDAARRYAAIDCGTNSIRLLIAEVTPDGARDVVRQTRLVRLGEGVDRTGRLSSAALERTGTALADYAALIRANDVASVRMVATSATRDARNRADFTSMVERLLGCAPAIIDAAEEARLSYGGAVDSLPGLVSPVLLVDIGGGSTEVALGPASESNTSSARLRSHSMDIGCVRMTERHLHDDPPTPAQVRELTADLTAALDRARADVPLDTAGTVVAVAGTALTVAALALDASGYDERALHGAQVDAATVADLADRLLAMPRSERGDLAAIEPGRVDVIGAGAVILGSVLTAAGARGFVASAHDILDGIVSELAGVGSGAAP